MRMFVWETATPYRDGDIEAGIVVRRHIDQTVDNTEMV